MTNKQLCPNCQQDTMETKNMDSSVTVNRTDYPVENIEYSKCPNCGEEAVWMDQARRNDKRFADAKRAASDLLISSEITDARNQWGLTQSLTSQLLGGGANSFNKYESGAVIQSAAMDLVIRLIRDVPGTLKYVADLKGIEVDTMSCVSQREPSKASRVVVLEAIEGASITSRIQAAISVVTGSYFDLSNPLKEENEVSGNTQPINNLTPDQHWV